MKRLLAVAIVALALPVYGQVRGVPASVTSFGHGRSDTPGAPASVTSLGPHGFAPKYSQPRQHDGGFRRGNSSFNDMCSTAGPLIPSAMGCTPVTFNNQLYGLPVNAPPSRSRGGYIKGRGPNYYPVYVPYAVPVVVEEEPLPVYVEEEAEESPALTVFERRANSAPLVSKVPPIDESRVYHPAPTPPSAEREERLAPAILLIYKDGRQREVQNYAIMGNYLYDIGTFVAQKIPLAELNLKATVKANDERGVEFSLPSSSTP